MTTVGTSEVGLRPNGQLGVVLSSLQTVLGVVLLAQLGFVLYGSAVLIPQFAQ